MQIDTTMEDKLRIVISGGGTGGHIFPAISIANAIKEQCPDADILFVGAEGRMEMQRVPAAGYPIKGLPVAGFNRKNLLKNIPVLIKLFKSQRMARQIIKDYLVKGYAVNERIHKEQIGELRQLVGMLGRTIQNQSVMSEWTFI